MRACLPKGGSSSRGRGQAHARQSHTIKPSTQIQAHNQALWHTIHQNDNNPSSAHLPQVQHNDLVCIHDRAQPVSHNHHGAVGAALRQRGLRRGRAGARGGAGGGAGPGRRGAGSWARRGADQRQRKHTRPVWLCQPHPNQDVN